MAPINVVYFQQKVISNGIQQHNLNTLTNMRNEILNKRRHKSKLKLIKIKLIELNKSYNIVGLLTVTHSHFFVFCVNFTI